MQMSDSREIAAPPGVVWQAILDPDVLRACIPGCESLSGSVAEGYQAVVKQKVGPVSATFTGVVQITDIIEGRSLRISGEGKGGVAGFAKGGADMALEPTESGTRLTYTVDASVGGKIAQVGQRLIDGVAKSMAESFFKRFDEEMTRRHGPPPEEQAVEPGKLKKMWGKLTGGGKDDAST